MNNPKTAYKIVGISGSLRINSTNTALLRLIIELAPKDRIASFEIMNYITVPVYNNDFETFGVPDDVLKISKKISEADAVYLSTPEYNYSISSPMKNLIDWLCRVKPNPLLDKPCAIASVSAG